MANDLKSKLQAKKTTVVPSNQFSQSLSMENQKKELEEKKAVKREQKLLTVRIDSEMYEMFSIYCEAMGITMSKDIKTHIKNVILNNEGLINNNRK